MRVVGDRVMLKELKDGMSAGGIFIPASADVGDVRVGEILGLGTGEQVESCDLNVGDRVAYLASKMDLHNPYDKEQRVIPANYIIGVL